MTVLFKNNAASTLSSGITNVATSITVANGALFPSLTAGQTFYATLTQSGTETSWEVVLVTARAGNVLTVVRGQDGTTAVSWTSGSKIELRLTAAVMDAMAQEADLKTIHGKSILGTGNLILSPAEVYPEWFALSFNGSYADSSVSKRTPHGSSGNITNPTTGSRTSDGYIQATNTDAKLNYSAYLGDLTGNDFTIEFDLYIPNGNDLGYFFGPTGGVYMYAGSSGATADLTLNGYVPSGSPPYTGTFSTNAWHHIAFSTDYFGTGTWRLFVDGFAVDSNVMSAAPNFSALSIADLFGVINVGSRSDLPAMAGMRMDNVLITKTAKYTAAFTPPGAIAEPHVIADVTGLQAALDGKQTALVSGTNIKTINGTSLLGSGNLAVQATLVSATNIKTINGSSILGAGDLSVAGGGGGTGDVDGGDATTTYTTPQVVDGGNANG